MKQIVNKCLSIFTSVLMLITCLPDGVYAQKFMMEQPFVQSPRSDDDFAFKNKQIQLMSNKAGIDIREEISSIEKELKALGKSTYRKGYTVRDVNKFKKILEKYMRFLINLDDSQSILAELQEGKLKEKPKGKPQKKITPLDLLARRYAEVPGDGFETLEDYYKRRISELKFSVRSLHDLSEDGYKVFIRQPYGLDSEMLITTRRKMIYTGQDIVILEMALKDSYANEYTYINDIYVREIENMFRRLLGDERDFEESAQWANQTFRNIEREVSEFLDFSIPERKAQFFKSLSDKVVEMMENNKPGSSDGFLKALFISKGDTAEIAASKFQRFYSSVAKEIPASSRNYLEHMMFLLNFMNKEQFAEYMATSKPLTGYQPKLVKEMQDFASEQKIQSLIEFRTKGIKGPIDIYEDLYKNAICRMSEKQGLKNVGKIAAKSLPTIMAVFGSLFILHMIVSVDATGNSFVNSINPVTLKNKIKNGTATDMEKYAYYMHPSSSKYILEDPLEFASVIIPVAEAITNPVYSEMMNDPIFQIKGNCDMEKAALEEELDNTLKDLEISQSLDIELPQM